MVAGGGLVGFLNSKRAAKFDLREVTWLDISLEFGECCRSHFQRHCAKTDRMDIRRLVVRK